MAVGTLADVCGTRAVRDLVGIYRCRVCTRHHQS